MKKYKIISLILVLAVSLSMIGCGRDTGEGDIDESKTQLYVANFDGGLGDAWLKKVADNFEKANSETEFESGKKGVQVHVYNDKTIDGVGLTSILANDSGDSRVKGNAIYFTESVSYYELINSGAIAEITDIVTEKTEDYDLDKDGAKEKVSIADKIDPALLDYFKTSDNKFYGLPFYSAFFGMYYDVDLFDENDYYFKTVTSTTLDGSVDEKSVGPDGLENTADDGLPATYAQFDVLLQTLRVDGLYPFIWSSTYTEYFPEFLTNFWADYEGYENAMLNVSLSGTATDLIESFDEFGNPVYMSPTEITSGKNGNAYLLQRQAGKYYALDFAYKLLTNGNNYDPLSVGSGLSHTGAQERFLNSVKIAGKEGAQRIAMLIEGSWWENEADGFFATMAKTDDKYSRENRRIAIMPIPKIDENSLGKPTVFNVNNSACFINKNTPESQMPVAKAFFKFAHSNESLSTFNAYTSVTRPFSYTITEEDKEKISYFGNNLYEFMHTSNVVYTRNSKNEFYLNNEVYFSQKLTWDWTSIVGGQKMEGMSLVGKFRNMSCNAKDWFNGLSLYHKNNWSTLVGN